jgi:hypothetical protein
MVSSSMEPNVPAVTLEVAAVSQSLCTRVAPFNTITRAFREIDLKKELVFVPTHIRKRPCSIRS